MNFLQTLRHKLFGGRNGAISQVPREQNPWEKVAASDSGQLSPAAMRETYADYFLYMMYEKLGARSGIGLANFTDAITADTIVEFDVPWLSLTNDKITYNNGSMYLCGDYNVFADYKHEPGYYLPGHYIVRMTTFGAEQDKLVRQAIMHFIRRVNTQDIYPTGGTYRFRNVLTPTDKLPRGVEKRINEFMSARNRWWKDTPLGEPKLCDGCSRQCQLGKNVYERNMADDEFIRTDYVPTINYCLADKFHDKSGNLVSADKGVWPTQYLTAREIAKRCPSYEKQR